MPQRRIGFSRFSPFRDTLIACALLLSEGSTTVAFVTGQQPVVVLLLAGSTFSIARSLHLVLGQA